MADILSTRLHLVQFMSTGHHPDLPTDHDPVVLLSIACALMFSFRFPPFVLLLVPEERAVLLAVVPVGETRRGGEKWCFHLVLFFNTTCTFALLQFYTTQLDKAAKSTFGRLAVLFIRGSLRTIDVARWVSLCQHYAHTPTGPLREPTGVPSRTCWRDGVQGRLMGMVLLLWL